MPAKIHKIGIVGGGQHAQMLIERGLQMGLNMFVLCENKQDPAAARYPQCWVKGQIFDSKSLKKFSNLVDVITFENEQIPAHTLRKSLNPKVECFPKIQQLAILQDRWPQKELLWDYNIPTASFIKINGKDELDMALKVFPKGYILKQRVGAQDSQGLHIIRNPKDLARFKNNYPQKETQFIAEELINCQREYSLILCRNSKNNFFALPLLEVQQKNFQCHQVFGPSHHKKAKNLTLQLKKLLTEINYVGVIAFELLDNGHELFVNEIVPRVHNTGHISQDAFSIDQFELHLRALLNLSFPQKLTTTKFYLMQNLIGSSTQQPLMQDALQGRLHWYGKTKNRPLRKMGHINYTADNWSDIKSNLKKDLARIKI